MANIFPKSANWLPIKILIAGVSLITIVVLGMSYYNTPKYTRVGYQPVQPIAYDHSLHVTQLGLDCRYCHTGIEESSHANVPDPGTCMRCHAQIKSDSPKLAVLRDAWATGRPIQWIKIHKAPDYVYFNHAAHVNRGISCVHCHGQINHMQVVWHDQPQSMSWCLDCHRNPEQKIRPVEHVFNLDWKPPQGVDQIEMGKKLVSEWNVHPPVTCAGCHR